MPSSNKAQLVARFNSQFLGFNPQTHRYVLTGLLSEHVIHYDPTPEWENVLVFGDIANICAYAELSPTSFRLELLTVTTEPFPGFPPVEPVRVPTGAEVDG